ncbi:MAG TPA: chaperone modulator CbpM [Gammaproteobacteria bacterium]|nr:chaperone modulator CbpM [Gammaproteobacteria bacterium]
MTENITIEGILIDRDTLYTLHELCRSCGVQAEVIVEMVEVGLLEPQGRDPIEWRFPSYAIARIQSTLRLRRDLDVNLEGAALALELMDEVRHLRTRVAMLERQLEGL